ncbi:MAG: carboxypeptidase regulatory-like domain-containing protein [candidate division Zixibacteria bacterium]|nr:carboxypeptidase regulatory-like domain-containing protein [candidate division Zixibacteria bacterium]
MASAKRCIGLTLMISVFLTIFSSAIFAMNQNAMRALDELQSTYPGTKYYTEEDAITKIYGAPFSEGSNPLASAENFRLNHAAVFSVDPADLHQECAFNDQLKTQQLMYDPATGQYGFTLVYYTQYKGNLPVFNGELRLLVRNESNYPLVMAVSTIKNLEGFDVSTPSNTINPEQIQLAFLANYPELVDFNKPRTVIWAGKRFEKTAPTIAIDFIAGNGQPATEKYRFVVDPAGKILYQENLVIDVNVTGQVNGLATENFKAEQCGNEVSTGMPYARVFISGGNSAYADSLGAYTITNGGSSAVTVVSTMRGHWFRVYNQAGAVDSLYMSVTPPGPANFTHNSSNTEYIRAQVNGYLHSNVVRDYTLKYNPTYPTIYTQTEFPVYVNDNTGYCPGNAWYDGVSLTFCRAGSGYPNTAFSTVIHHEYGHHLVAMAGSGQGQYGEGMGDVMGQLITDNPGAAIGFYGDCVNPLRTGDNSIQYPCNDEIHYCGQLLSGSVWSTRNALLATNPTTYRDIISNLAINAMLLHTGEMIEPSITVDYLTLDDNDGNINNGTPHFSEICTGFGAHNLDCPALTLVTFSYPNGRPATVLPSGGTTVRVTVTGVGATPQPGTGRFYYNLGSGWLNVAMTQVSNNVYDATFPTSTCGADIKYYFTVQTTTGITVTDPSDAPTGYYSAVSASAIITLFSDNFSSNLGWTGMGGAGEWTISAANGGSGSDYYGGPDPSTDHSPTSDDGILGTDNTSGTGGDYSPSLSTTYWVTSPVINCSGRTHVSLEFYRWLGVERNNYDHAYLAAYNGSSWVTLFENGSTTIDESSWNLVTYDVSAVADNNPNFQIRFGIGPTDSGWEYCGWNIDDLKITALECMPTTGTINGIVSGNSGPLADAVIIANDGAGHVYRDTTFTGGAYSMTVLAGTYTISYSHPNYIDTSRTGIAVNAGATVTINMQMRARPGAAAGMIASDFTLLNPIQGVVVRALGFAQTDTTNETGEFYIGNIPANSYDFSFTHPSYNDTILNGINITAGNTTWLELVMTPSCTYSLGDINGDGNLIAGDVTYGVRYFKGLGPSPADSCYLDSTHSYLYVAGDVNGNCEFRGSDITKLVSYFKGLTTLDYCHFFPPPFRIKPILINPKHQNEK